MSALPVSARLAWWGTSWLRGQSAADDLVEEVLAGDVTHAVSGLGERTETLVGALAAVRAAGATGIGLALPRHGDPLGLGGPGPFNTAALEAGEAAVVDGAQTGLVPVPVGPTVRWRAMPAHRRQLPDVGEADRALRMTLLDATAALAALDVGRWRPEVADRLIDLSRHPMPAAPAGVPARCVGLAGRAMLALEVTGLALDDDGGAVSGGEIRARREALVGLERAGRRGLVAACSPQVWPPA